MPFPIFFWLDNTQKYISLVEKSFDSEDKNIEDEYNRLKKESQEKKDNEDYYEDAMDMVADDSYVLEFYIKQNFRQSTIASIFSFLEYRLEEISDGLSKRMDIVMKPKDFAGLGTDRFSKYLLYASGIDLKKDKKYKWSELERIKKIRNIIIHDSSKIDPQDKDINIYISKNPNLSINHSKLLVNKDYLNELLMFTEKFFNLLESELEKKLPNIFDDSF